MTDAMRGDSWETVRDARIVFRKEWVLCRRVSTQLITALIPTAVLLLMQLVPFLYVLINRNAPASFWSPILGNIFKSATATVGPALILITATSLGSVTIARDRFGGALEGTLATPLSTAGLWIGKTTFSWTAGGVVYLLFCSILWGFAFLLPSSAFGLGAAELGAFIGEAGLLLLTTLLLVGLTTLIQLGAPPAVAVIATTTPVLVICLLSYYLIDGLFKGKGVPFGPALLVRVELLAVPGILILLVLLGRSLLRREAILMKSR